MKEAKQIALSAGTSLAAYIALLAIAAALIERGNIKEGNLQLCAWVCVFLAVFIGIRIFCSRWKAGSVAACTAAILCAIALLGFLINDGLDFAGVLKLAIPSILGAALAWVTHFGKQKRSKGKRRSRK